MYVLNFPKCPWPGKQTRFISVTPSSRISGNLIAFCHFLGNSSRALISFDGEFEIQSQMKTPIEIRVSCVVSFLQLSRSCYESVSSHLPLQFWSPREPLRIPPKVTSFLSCGCPDLHSTLPTPLLEDWEAVLPCGLHRA